MVLSALTATTNAPQKFGGWHNVGLLTFLQFAISGFVYFAYSAIFPFMVDDMGWNRGSASIAHSIALVMFGLGYPVTAILINRIGAVRTYRIGIILMLVGLLPIATLMDSMWQWLILWGFVVGFALSLTAPIVGQTILLAWFARRRAISIGIVMTGGAVGGAISQPLLAEVIRQTGSWQSAWYVAIGTTVLAWIAVRFLVNKPADVGQFLDGIQPTDNGGDEADTQQVSQSLVYQTDHDWTIKEVLRTRSAYMLLLLSIAHLAAFFFLLNHGILFLTDGGMDPISAASIIGLTILGSGAMRIPIGWLGDKYNPRWLAFGSALLMLAGLFGIWQANGFFLGALSSAALGAGYGGLLILNPIVIGNYYGERAFPIINAGFVPIVLPVSGAAPVLGGYIFEATGSYDLAFSILTGLLIIGTCAASILTPPQYSEA